MLKFFRKSPWFIDNKFRKRKYSTYSDYLNHQKSKLKKIKNTWLKEYDIKYRAELRKRLKKQNIVQSGMSVLCLAARTGTEVKSFLDIGCLAIGLDINPGKENKYVVYGDFHDIQFPNHSVDVIFTNSLDHAFDLKKLIKEIKRVLKPKGVLILEVVRGEKEGGCPAHYESFFWEKIDGLLEIFLNSGFGVIKRNDFEYPWRGQHISLRKLCQKT